MNNGFDSKVALVTGGGSGIGRETATLLARRGARVVIADLAEDNGRETVDSIKIEGGEASFIKTDVTDPNQVEAMITFAVDTYGGLHMAHNNAGTIHAPAPLHELDLEVWDKQLAINVRSMIYCLRFELKHMLDNGGGVIVNGSSLSGSLASPGIAGYTATKHASNGLTRAAAIDYAQSNIRVNAVAPGSVLTPFQGADEEAQKAVHAYMKMGRMATPQEVAQVVAFLLSDEASYLNGVVVPIDSGNSASF